MTDISPPPTPPANDPAPPPPPPAPVAETPAAPSGPGLDAWEAPAAAGVPVTTDSNITERVLAKLKADPRTGELAPAILAMVEQLAPLFAVKQEDAADVGAGGLNLDDVLIAMHDAVRDVRLEDDQAAVAAFHQEAANASPVDVAPVSP